MAGSIKFFIYRDDSGSEWAIKLDESNTEALNGSTNDYTDSGTAPTYEVPRNVEPRVCVYKRPGGLVVKRVVALTTTLFNSAPTVLTIDGFTYGLTRKIGELRSIPFGADTGLDDGDAT